MKCNSVIHALSSVGIPCQIDQFVGGQESVSVIIIIPEKILTLWLIQITAYLKSAEDIFEERVELIDGNGARTIVISGIEGLTRDFVGLLSFQIGMLL